VANRLPNKSRVEVIRDERHDTANEKQRADTQRKCNAVETFDWLALWAISIAISAIFMAALAYFTDNDSNGAAAILAGAAIVIAFALFASAAPGVKNSKPD
jgi:hypothetical protein